MAIKASELWQGILAGGKFKDPKNGNVMICRYVHDGMASFWIVFGNDVIATEPAPIEQYSDLIAL